MIIVLAIRLIFFLFIVLMLIGIAYKILLANVPEFRILLRKLGFESISKTEGKLSDYENEADSSQKLVERITKVDKEKLEENRKVISQFEKETK